jgi:tetratricopeptide (TPR) repeat protein
MVARERIRTLERLQRPLITAILVVICFGADGTRAFASDEDSIQRALATGQQAMLERHYGEAVRVLRDGLKDNPKDNRLRLELGRAYLFSGADSRAIRLFREILRTEPDHRLAKLELARALGYGRQYAGSNEIYKQLLSSNAADEAAAIGLASNLLHQERSLEAQEVANAALKFHPNSLRLQEYKDRIEIGHLGGEEREVGIRRNLVEGETDYVNDSAGNHSWRSSERVDFRIRPGMTNRFLFEQQFQHGPDDSFEAVETFSEELRWRLRDSLLLSAGGGAVRFNNADVHAIYDASLAFQPWRRFVLGTGFSRVPITPDAEATEFRITAQGVEVFTSWTPGRWQINTHWSRQNYSRDKNIASRQSGEVIREWGAPRLTFEMGYRYRRYSFDQQLAHGYFSPDSYQSHLGLAGVVFHPGRMYRGEFLVRSGLEAPSGRSDFGAAWEIHSRNEVLLGNWTLELDYSKYHLVQNSGAFRADAGRFAFTYHF